MTPRAVAPLALLVAVLAACSSDDDPDSKPAPTSSASGSGSGTASGSGSATPSASPTAVALPDGCTTLLPFDDLDKALGKPVFGQTRFIKGQAEPGIKRTGRITCRYGIQTAANGKDGPAALEVGISSYADEASATARVAATVSSARSAGDTQNDVTVAGGPATVLGSTRSSTLVLAKGPRTVAITVAAATLPPANAAKNLPAVAEVVMANLE